MAALDALKGWTPSQRHAVIAAFAGWTLDAFDFFVLTFVTSDLAKTFGVKIPAIALAVTLTLAVRPLGAFLFGRLADNYGRKPVLALNILLYSIFGFATAFAPTLTSFLIIRALFGVAMGGIWGIGASLAFESIPSKARGFVSGLLQSGYPSGYLVASVVFGLVHASLGWRAMFMVGLVPGLLLALYIWFSVAESPVWKRPAVVKPAQHLLHLVVVAAILAVMLTLLTTFGREKGLLYIVAIAVPLLIVAAVLTPFIRQHWKLALYAILLMTGFNFFSHGTQDLYPTFLRVQHHFDDATVTFITVVLNCGAIVGGLFFASLSQSFGRRKTVIMVTLLSLPVIYFWAYAPTAITLAAGAFAMQVFVQGAWGVVPVHLNELSPPNVRGTFAGTVYQLGNLIASVNAVYQAEFAEHQGGNYSLALAVVAGFAALLIATMMFLGPEAKDASMGRAET
jgi:SHS family lactate transporter-like MFS transporter